jgi:hypothetical protein
MNTSNKKNESYFFKITEGIAKKGAAVFNNKVTLSNSPFVGLAGIASIPIFAVTLFCDVVIGLKRSIAEKFSPLTLRNVKIAPAPQDLLTPKTPARADDREMVKYLLTGNIKKNEHTIAFLKIIEKTYINENADFLKDFYIFSENLSIKKAEDITKLYFNTENPILNVSDFLHTKINTAVYSEDQNIQNIKKLFNEAESQIVRILIESCSRELYTLFPKLGIDSVINKSDS